MVLVRPAAMSDVDSLLELASLAGAGLTTLPKDKSLLSKRVRKSVNSLRELSEKPGDEAFLFVMEDSESRRVVGACGIVAKVGGYQPFYSYQIETSLFESKEIKISKEVPILRLLEDHDGPCEIGSLFLHPEFRKDHNGRFLQLVRFLFIAEHPEMFEPVVVSEIRGVSDKDGRSPFWDALGKHFFGIDFAEADRLSVVNKKFIADLMPDHPIYIPLLPQIAQDVIGQPHPESAPAVRNLEREGFKFANMVDIFDAGPVVKCERDQIRTVRESERKPIIAITDQPIQSPVYMMGTTGSDFRAVKGEIDLSNPKGARISDQCASALEASVGDSLRYVTLSSIVKA